MRINIGARSSMVYLDEAAVHNLLKPAELIATLREAFISNIDSPQRTHHHIPGSEAACMLLMPAWRAGGSIGVKVLTLDPARTQLGVPSIDGLYMLMNGSTGVTEAIIAARALTAARTAAASALAASYLAREDASTLLMIGAGNLAAYIIEAHCAVRDYKKILIWGRNTKKAETVRSLITKAAETIIVNDLAESIAHADVISCATSSTIPLIHKRYVRPGTHVDLIGSYTPQMRETDNALFQGARVFVDTKSAIAESGDLLEPWSAGVLDAATIRDLAELIRTPPIGRSNSEEITIFKAAGTATADLAAAEYLLACYAKTQRGSTSQSSYGSEQ
jgi:alanine dehydrogenase